MQPIKTSPSEMVTAGKINSKRGILLILGIFIFYVILLLSVGFWLFNKYDWNQMLNDLKSKLENVTNSESGKLDATQNTVTNSSNTIVNNYVKNTYSTNTVGIQFEYPAGWEVEEYPLDGDYQVIIQPSNAINVNVIILSSRNTTCASFDTKGYIFNQEDNLEFIDGFSVSVYDKELTSDKMYFQKIHVSTNTRCYEIQLNNFRSTNDYSAEFDLIVNSIKLQYR